MSFVLQASAQLRLRSRGFFPTRGNPCVKLLEVWTFIFVVRCSQLVTHSATVVRTFCPRLFRIKTTGAAWHAWRAKVSYRQKGPEKAVHHNLGKVPNRYLYR